MSSIHIDPPLLYTVATIFPAVCIVIVAARFRTRMLQRLKCGWDDWLVVPALILVLAMAATIIAGTAKKGLGHKTPVIDPAEELTATSPEQTVARICYFSINLMQIASLMFIKLSCMLFYKRIFSTGASNGVDFVIYGILGLIVVWGLSFFFGFLFLCGRHVDYVWSNVVTELKCSGSTTMIDQAVSITDVITDLIVLLFPIPLIWGLQMSRRSKIAVTGIFFLGALALLASIARTVIIFEELDAKFRKNADQDFVSSVGIYFMFIEVCFALCSICLPTLSGAFKLDRFQNFVQGFSSLFSMRQSSKADSRERLESQNSGSKDAQYPVDIESMPQSHEMQNKKYEVTKDMDYTHRHSMEYQKPQNA